MSMEASLRRGGPPPAARVREVVDGPFATLAVVRGSDEIKAYIGPDEYVTFAEDLLRAGMEFLRLARERPEKAAGECPTTAPSS